MPSLDQYQQVWPQLQGLLDRALDLPINQRSAFVDSLEEEYDPLKPQLRRLLMRAEALAKGDFLETLDAGNAVLTYAAVHSANDTIGPYRLLREIGRGGMGAVWLAERTDRFIDRPIALKLPYLDSSRVAVSERIVRERKILAALTHPNIARLYDAGIASNGQPYLALEYVEGRSIDEYCRDRSLDVRSRLALFLQVAHAVDYAHSKLIIHRDLKPANIIVSDDGQVHLLDFGIAKLLESNSDGSAPVTEIANRALTPNYASPEHIVGRALSTASDVYSLGVILYELLTNNRPYPLSRTSRGALEEAILNVDPQKPSSVSPRELAKTLRGDLDTICLTALQKDPERRYRTVNAFAGDITRYLSDEPVLARPDRLLYRLSKLIRRYRWFVIGGTAAFAGMAAFAILASLAASTARKEQARAEEVKSFIASIFSDANPYQQGAGKALSGVELLKLADERLAQMQDVPADVRVELMNVVASSLMGLDDAKTAEGVLALALEAGATLPSVHKQRLLTRRLLAQNHRLLDRPAQARAQIEPVVAALRAEKRAVELVPALLELVRVASRERKYDEAASVASEALALITSMPDQRMPEKVDLLMLMYSNYRFRGDFEKSRDAAMHAFAAAKELYAGSEKHPRVIDVRFYYASALSNFGQTLEAVKQYREVLRDTESLFGPGSRQLGLRLSSTAAEFADAGFLSEATSNAKRGREILLAVYPPNTIRIDAATMENIGRVELSGRDEAAVESLTRALAGFRQLYGNSHATTMDIQTARALALCYAKHYADAESALQEVKAANAPLELNRFDFRAFVQGACARLSGRPQDAIALEQQALSSITDQKIDGLQRARVLSELGRSQAMLKDVASACIALNEAESLFSALQSGVTPEHAEVTAAQRIACPSK